MRRGCAPPSTLLATLRRAQATAGSHSDQAVSRKLISVVRGDLDWIVMKALEKNRRLRYETVNGLAEDVQRFTWTKESGPGEVIFERPAVKTTWAAASLPGIRQVRR